MRVIAKILQTLNMNKNFENKDGGPRFGRGILGDPGAEKEGEGKSKRAEKYGTKESKERREELFSPFFTFLRVIFFRPFRLSLVPTICPWVSEDVAEAALRLVFETANQSQE